MVNKTWLGGGNNQANNPNDWSPAGVPTVPDGMVMTQGTMNIDGFNLEPVPGLPGAANNFGLITSGTPTVNLSDGATADIGVSSGHTTINVRDGASNLFLAEEGVLGNAGNATVNIAGHAEWVGGFQQLVSGSTLLIKGGGTFVNSGIGTPDSLVNGPGSTATIDANIAGTGLTEVIEGAVLTIGGSVGSGQVISVDAIADTDLPLPAFLTIEHPKGFAGLVQLGKGEIDLNGLAKADSYTFNNDLLSIYNGKTVIDTLRLAQESLGNGFLQLDVVKTHSGVAIFTAINPVHPAGTILPVHV
jgi:hypothetical protein